MRELMERRVLRENLENQEVLDKLACLESQE